MRPASAAIAGLVALLVLFALAEPARAQCDGTALPAGTGYRAANGQIYAPDGKPFKAMGVDDMNVANDYQQLLASFPNINHVRVPVYDFENPADFQAAVQYLTSHGVVVELENHSSTDGQDRGGGTGDVPAQGSGWWNQDMAWYQQVGQMYGNNPLVWAGSTNEPPTNGDLSGWQQAEYQAYRSGGADAPFELEINGYADTQSFGYAQNAGAFANDTNLVADIHIYPWLTNGADLTTDSNFIAQSFANFQQNFQVAGEGALPIIMGEIGPSTDGQTMDNNGYEMVAAALNSGYGYDSWWYAVGGPDSLLNGDGSLNQFGQETLQAMTNGSTCPEAIVTPNTVPTTDTGGGVYESTTAPIVPTPEQNIVTQQQNIQNQQDQVTIQNEQPAPLPGPFTSTNNGFTAPNVTTPNLGPPQAFVPTPPVNLPETVLDTAPPTQPADNPYAVTANIIAGELPMISPIGTFLTSLDNTLVGGIDNIVTAEMPAYAGVLGAWALVSLALLGLRVVKQDYTAMTSIVGKIVTIAVILQLATNIATYDYYVRGLLYTSLPNFIGNPNQAINGTQALALSLDHTWAQTWVQVTKVWQQANIFDVSDRLAAAFCAVTVGAALAVTGLVYLAARSLMAIAMVIGPYAIGCLLFDFTKPYFDRWLGKCISLVILQVAAIAIVNLMAQADTTLMNTIMGQGAVGAALTGGFPTPTKDSDVQSLVSMVIFFGMGAFMVVSLPAFAYSIGTGMSAAIMPIFQAAIAAMSAGASAVGSAISGIGAIGGRAEGLSMGMDVPPAESAASSTAFFTSAGEPAALETMTAPAE